MKNIKVALINNIHYCMFTNNITNIKEFVDYLNQHYNSFVELEFYIEEGCVAPFFIEEKLKTEKQYFNPSSIRLIKECEISILREWEYEEKLKKVISEKCVHCVNHSEDTCEQDFKSHIEHIDLNGECYGFELKNKNKR